MEATPNKYITVTYELYTTTNGEKSLMEKAPEDQPFQVITGVGFTLDAFENQIKDLEEGATFDFAIPSSEAYGEYHQDRVLTLPKNIFVVDGKFDDTNIQAGKVVPLMNEEGDRMNGTVLEVTETDVITDMNHPLAGKDLNFVGKVMESRPASAEEVQSLLNMMSGEGAGGCDSCGSGDGCGGGCGSNDGDDQEGCGCGCGCN
ncbi:MAG: FKBP-type peptidyl-prolyl cis-trans isomerase [Bacteroidaceae bacterium]|nr:FKBP-type peptidyl-prolyl cis-trans isomerase [Bacteroidaceae bacterium]